MAERIIKSSLTVKSMGDPRKVAANMEHDGMLGLLGTIVGIVTGINTRTNDKDGTTYEGLVGAFAGIATDPQRPEVTSKICYLPDAVHEPIANTFKKAREKDDVANVRFALECGVRKGGIAGFSWEFKPLISDGAEEFDPLAEIRAAVKNKTALPLQTEQQKQDVAKNVQPPKEIAKPNAQTMQNRAETAAPDKKAAVKA